MANTDRLQLAHQFYRAFMSGDREFYEYHLSSDFTFSSRLDVGLDRAGYFERCWPGAGQGGRIDFVRFIESIDEAVITYESTSPNGSKGRNTEIMGFDGDKVNNVEVYFGWDVRP
jgi:hypothetical protein